MPSRQPFTSLCQQLARPRASDRVDLHIHTTYSDGTYTPAQVIDLARRSGLPALALTDHDTIAALEPARQAAGNHLEIVPGVELTARFRDREFHLLGYFFREDDETLLATLERIREDRLERYHELMDYLHKRGLMAEDSTRRPHAPATALSRRHAAQALVRAGKAADERQAFYRYLGDRHELPIRAVGVPVAEAIAVIRGAGGVSAWAHPALDCNWATMVELRDLGLQAVEVEYPGRRRSRINQLRDWARELGLGVTGGSDCHGPGPRAIGHAGIS
jgi:predicted metal-dependent phosphoesterase TrpH